MRSPQWLQHHTVQSLRGNNSCNTNVMRETKYRIILHGCTTLKYTERLIYNIHVVNRSRTPGLLVTVNHAHLLYQNQPNNIYKSNTKTRLPLIQTTIFDNDLPTTALTEWICFTITISQHNTFRPSHYVVISTDPYSGIQPHGKALYYILPYIHGCLHVWWIHEVETLQWLIVILIMQDYCTFQLQCASCISAIATNCTELTL
jgi:hypothetical protein